MSRIGTSAGPFFVSEELEKNQNTGTEYVQIWEGSEAECRAKYAFFNVGAQATRLRLAPKGDGNWQLRASFPLDTTDPGEKPVDIMELEVNAVMRSAYQSPVYRGMFSTVAVANSTLPIVADVSRKYASGLPKREDGGANDGKFLYAGTYYTSRELAVIAEAFARITALGITGVERTAAMDLFNNIAFRGVTSFIEYQQVFRRTVTAGSPAQIRASYVGVGKIWTTAEVTAFENIPNDGWFTLPAGMQWHKDKPRVHSVYGQKTQLTYNYTEIVTASRLFYQAYGAATLLDT